MSRPGTLKGSFVFSRSHGFFQIVYIFTVLDLFGWNMSEEGGLGALLGAYISDSDVEDQNSADS